MGWSLVHIQHGRGLQDEFDQTFRPHTFPLAAESSFQVAGPAATDRDCTCPLASLRERCITVQPNGLTIEVPVWIPPATLVAVCPPLITNATRPHRRPGLAELRRTSIDLQRLRNIAPANADA
jgi:hypothetical protein